MSDDLRQRYAEALANAECEKQPRCVNCMADSVMVVRDEELERTRRELEKVLCQQVWDAMTDEADGEVARLRYELEQWHAAYGKAVLPETLARLWEWRERAETAEAAIARVRALHKPFQRRDKVAYCDHCSVSAGSPWRRYVLVPWPCETLAALDDTREDETRG